jgi:hypothetical protein
VHGIQMLLCLKIDVHKSDLVAILIHVVLESNRLVISEYIRGLTC